MKRVEKNKFIFMILSLIMIISQITVVTANAQEGRFKTALVGSGASGNITVNADSSITLSAIAQGMGSGGKLADNEDGFLYYYTEINPTTENFEMTATFKVDDSSSKDNQSGFGIMAIDHFVDGDSSVRYFNSAGTMIRKYMRTVDGFPERLDGAPGGYFVTGYTGELGTRALIDTAPFDWNWKNDSTTTPKFEDGEEYILKLKKDNTGFHSSMYDSTNNSWTDEIICYEPDLLVQQDRDKYYVGICAARRITVTVKDISFSTSDPATDPPREERPKTTVTPSFVIESGNTIGTSSYTALFKADYVGTVDIYDSGDNLLANDIEVDPKNNDTFLGTANLELNEGTNNLKAIFTPKSDSDQGYLITSTETVDKTPINTPFSVTYNSFGNSENAIYVSPSGSADGIGTKSEPLDIYTAIDYAQPGQEIILLDGTYNLTKKICVNRGHNGTNSEPITIMSESEKKAQINLANSLTGGFEINGDYWHIYNLEIYNGLSNAYPVRITGNYNTAEKLTIHDNGNTGLQINGNATEPLPLWPSNNTVLSCETYNNCDKIANDADGFAAKLTIGEGNVFRYCISHNNIDDGFDLYSKSTTGVMGAVTLDQCVAYDNGHLTVDSENTAVGEGNGFKLGVESISVNHKLINSIAFNNLAKGVFSNTNPCGTIQNVTSYNNTSNLYLNTNATTTSWVLDGYISYNGSENDSITLKYQDSLSSITNYIDGANTSDNSINDDWFENLDTSVLPTITKDGSIDMHGLLALSGTAESGVGAVISANPNPTVIEIGDEIEPNITDINLSDDNIIFNLNNSKNYKSSTVYIVEYKEDDTIATIKQSDILIDSNSKQISIPYTKLNSENTTKIIIWKDMKPIVKSVEVPNDDTNIE